MRDYAELVARLKQSDDNCVAEHDECPAECDSPGYTIFLEAADAIEELLAAVPKWISVEERLPDEDDMVFFYYEWAGQSGTVYKEVSLSTLGEMQHFGFKMIAWMPLPAPPKEDANENHS